MNNSFAGLPWEPIIVDVWAVSSAAEPLGEPPERMQRESRALVAGAPWELEGAIAHSPRRAALAAAVQDTRRAHQQLRMGADPALLLERHVRVTRYVPDRIPSLYTGDRTTRIRFGLAREVPDAPVGENDCALREMVATLRSHGWTGGIIVPGVIDGAVTALIPRAFLMQGRLSIAETGRRRVPPEVVEHALGIRILPSSSGLRVPTRLVDAT